MPVPTNPVMRQGLLIGVLGTLLLSAGQANAETPSGPALANFVPNFIIKLDTQNGASSNPGLIHPTGELGFKFLDFSEDPTCDSGNLCLDLSVWNKTSGTITSSSMVSAAFNVPGIDGLVVPDFPNVPGSYLSDTSSLYGCNSADNCVVGALEDAFSVAPDNEISGIEFDVCATSQNDCQSGGKPSGLSNGEFTIVRFLLPYAVDEPLSAAAIAEEFRQFYTYGTKPAKATDFNVIGRWQSIECGSNENCPDSDKIGSGIPEEPGPRESVPGPLPLMGAAAAFGFSRKLRHRIAAVGKRSPYML